MGRVDALVQQLMQLGSIDQEATARRAALAVLHALGLRLPAPEAAALASLGGELAAPDEAAAARGPGPAVATALGLGPADAARVADAAIVVLLEHLGAHATAVHAALPPELRPAPPTPPPDARPERAGHPTEDRTLAGGRPGHRAPLADAAAERAHQHAIARSDDPHADTRLSSARAPGAAPGRSLADGRG